MIRYYIILVFIQGFLTGITAQVNLQVRHIYAPISDYYYLDILPDLQYSLKVGMFGDKYLKGDYKIISDTLELISFDYLKAEYNLTKRDKKYIAKRFSRFLVNDSLLIPISLRSLIPFSRSMDRDSTIVKEYIQNDGHAYYKLSFLRDSTFIYKTGLEWDKHKTQGSWRQEGDIIELYPNDTNNLLYWICTDNKLTIFENYLIGRTYNTNENVVEFQYLIGLKPAANTR